MQKRKLLLTLLMFGLIGVQAQTNDKLSATTRAFMASATAGVVPASHRQAGAYQRADVPMIDAFISFTGDDTSRLEQMGVVVKSRFRGMVVGGVPVAMLDQLATLPEVTKIDVGEVAEPQTDQSRLLTGVADILTLSDAAQAAGIAQAYDGRGVVVGIIDQGIDFQHSAFKDADGQSRIVRAYTLASDGVSLVTYSSPASIATLTTDKTTTSHGTHTASIAAGTAIDIGGATYGGMAPKAELAIAGLSTLTTTAIANSIKAITDYADSVGKPSVISLSISTSTGPRDGTGSLAKVIEQCTGPGHVIVYAASNSAGRSSEGGVYLHGIASRTLPLMTALRSHRYSDANDSYRYDLVADLWARTPQTPLAARVIVIDKTTNSRLWQSDKLTSDVSVLGLSGFSTYYSGTTFSLAFTQDADNGKCNVRLTMEKVVTKKSSKKNIVTSSSYEIGIKLFPDVDDVSFETEVDGWMQGSYGYYAAGKAGDWVLLAGSDSCSVSDEAANPNVIVVGNYVSKDVVTDYQNTTHDYRSQATLGDIAASSGWCAEGCGPLGVALPTIAAPGTYVVSAVNHYDSGYISGSDVRVNADTANPYGSMHGTSMATPCVAGIIALLLQTNPELTPADVRTILTLTARRDSYTDGAHAAHFGLGKVDALASLGYVLSHLPAGDRLKGDVNRDGQLTLADVKALVRMILGVTSRCLPEGVDVGEEYAPDAADVNEDGKITIADVTALVNMILL